MVIRIILAILLLASPAFSAEILVRAQPHWMEIANTMGWTQKQLDEKDRVTTKGSPIVVKPDDWVWGGRERPPEYILIVLPNLSVGDVQEYLTPLVDTTAEFDSLRGYPLVAEKRFRFPKSFVDSVFIKPGGEIIINQDNRGSKEWIDSLIIERKLEK
jgi:hypothetical protein